MPTLKPSNFTPYAPFSVRLEHLREPGPLSACAWASGSKLIASGVTTSLSKKPKANAPPKQQAVTIDFIEILMGTHPFEFGQSYVA